MFSSISIIARSAALTSIMFMLLASSTSAFALPLSTNVSDEKAKADALLAEVAPVLPPVNDGPYVFVNEQQ
ncbi:MAG: hypothetical protein MJK15_18690, partial [Colwellia sp.]|nr:hypothetical protein [Colwellia sp.]